MRDDLHRTVAVPRPWKTVLRYAPNKIDRLTRMPGAIEEAVRSDLDSSLSPECVRSLRATLAHGLSDLLGSDSVDSAILRCATTIQTPADRELYEIVRTAAAFKRQDANVFVSCMRELTNRAVDRNYEHLVAAVRMEHASSARELRGYLEAARRSCDFSKLIDADGNIAPRKRARRKTVELNEVIAP